MPFEIRCSINCFGGSSVAVGGSEGVFVIVAVGNGVCELVGVDDGMTVFVGAGLTVKVANADVWAGMCGVL